MNQLCKECFHRQVCVYSIGNEIIECKHFANIVTLKYKGSFNEDLLMKNLRHGAIDRGELKRFINTRIIESHCSFLDHHQLINCDVDRSILFPNNITFVSKLQVVVPNKITSVSDAIDEMLRMED